MPWPPAPSTAMQWQQHARQQQQLRQQASDLTRVTARAALSVEQALQAAGGKIEHSAEAFWNAIVSERDRLEHATAASATKRAQVAESAEAITKRRRSQVTSGSSAGSTGFNDMYDCAPLRLPARCAILPTFVYALLLVSTFVRSRSFVFVFVFLPCAVVSWSWGLF